LQSWHWFYITDESPYGWSGDPAMKSEIKFKFEDITSGLIQYVQTGEIIILLVVGFIVIQFI